MNTAMLFILFCLIGVIAFFIGYRARPDKKNNKSVKYDGDFIINENDPNKDTICMQFYYDIYDLFSKKEVCFKVVHENSEKSRKNR